MHRGVDAEGDELMRLPDLVRELRGGHGIAHLPPCGVKSLAEGEDRDALRSQPRIMQHALVPRCVEDYPLIHLVAQDDQSVLERSSFQRLQVLPGIGSPGGIVRRVDHDHPRTRGDL